MGSLELVSLNGFIGTFKSNIDGVSAKQKVLKLICMKIEN